MSFSLDLRAHSEVGLVRKNNQDSGYASSTMLVVADGMGGAAAGDLASAVAVAEVRRADLRQRGVVDVAAALNNEDEPTLGRVTDSAADPSPAGDPDRDEESIDPQGQTDSPADEDSPASEAPESDEPAADEPESSVGPTDDARSHPLVAVLADAVTLANDKIADLVAQDHSLDGMGTTVCGAAFDGQHLGLVHIGDSRGYLVRDGEMSQLTHDHSWVQSLIDEGRITEEEAAVHPHRSLVLKVLNGHPTHQPDTALIEVRKGDRVMFCSDGLCGFTTDEVMAQALAEPDLDDVMTELIRAAHAGGGADNITIIIADVVDRDEALDAAAVAVIGAAEEVEIPQIDRSPVVIDLGDDNDGDDLTAGTGAAPAITEVRTRPVAPESDQGAVDQTAVDQTVEVDAEQARYQPTLAKRRRWVPLILLLVLLLVAGAATFAGFRWSRTQYYVGDNNGRVAVFNGLNGSVLGRPLAHVVRETSIDVSGLPVFYRQQVTNTIGADNLPDAERIVQELQEVAGTCSTTPPRASPSVIASTASNQDPGGNRTGPSTTAAPSSPAVSTPTSTAQPEGDC